VSVAPGRRAGARRRVEAPPPVGREAVSRALLDAGAELFADLGPARVSVRDVAARARVNHGLVHRHFGSKEGLLRAVLEDLSSNIHEEVSAAGCGEVGPGALAERLGRTLEAVARHPRYFRVLGRALLDGYPMDRLQGNFPVVRELVGAMHAAQAAGRIEPDLDAGAAVAVMVAAGLGWLLFEPYVLAATGQTRVPVAAARERALATCRRFAGNAWAR
jgi:TetR/AcrR family transcriptional regulator, repressor for neighboring sulfatase